MFVTQVFCLSARKACGLCTRTVSPERAKLSAHLAQVGATERTNRKSPAAIEVSDRGAFWSTKNFSGVLHLEQLRESTGTLVAIDRMVIPRHQSDVGSDIRRHTSCFESSFMVLSFCPRRRTQRPATQSPLSRVETRRRHSLRTTKLGDAQIATSLTLQRRPPTLLLLIVSSLGHRYSSWTSCSRHHARQNNNRRKDVVERTVAIMLSPSSFVKLGPIAKTLQALAALQRWKPFCCTKILPAGMALSVGMQRVTARAAGWQTSRGGVPWTWARLRASSSCGADRRPRWRNND